MSNRLSLKLYSRAKEELQIFVSPAELNRGVVPVLNGTSRHEGMWGSGCVAPRILNLGIRWRQCPISCPGRFILRERAPPAASLEKETGWAPF